MLVHDTGSFELGELSFEYGLNLFSFGTNA